MNFSKIRATNKNTVRIEQGTRLVVMGMSIPPPEEAQSFVSKTLLDTVLVSQAA